MPGAVFVILYSIAGKGLNQYSSINSGGLHSLDYDDNGNLTQAGAFVSLAAHTYEYDAEKRLKRVLQGETEVAEYEYDALGRRIRNMPPRWGWRC